MVKECVVDKKPAKGVYYGHNTGTPYGLCEEHLDKELRYGTFTINVGGWLFRHRHTSWPK